MKKTSFILSFYVLTFYYGNAQVELCQGAYFTEEQGKAFLDNHVPASLNKWQQRAAYIRNNMREGMELEKMPAKPTSKPIINGKRIMDGYSIENVAFESLPGFYVTGNLYRPLKKQKKYAGILCPHGHGNNPEGRFREQTQKRCGTLARMGAIVFVWDMIGQGDSKQCEHKMPKGVKLQTINSIRSLDFLLSLPEVDSSLVGITGESGGGTQTFILAALDPRVKVAVPTVMVSSYFFGGCTCESGMPIHKKGDFQTNNVEIAALTAPRPMLLISDGGDWTKHTPEVEYPFMQKIYQLYNSRENVSLVHLADEKHDYGPSKRKAMYVFMAEKLGLNLKAVQNASGNIDENPVKVLEQKDLEVFNASSPRPSNAVLGDEAVISLLDAR
ncbi:MAG: acetylxylan esterase [Agriterribacter sp.]